MADKKQDFRVVIVGGSIAGLTLAHCLMHYGIDFVVLEGRDKIAPQEGASISFWPFAGLVLDQLGIFDDLREQVIPLHTIYNWECTGKLICAMDTPKEMIDAHGYPAAFLERKKALELFYHHMGEGKKSIFTGKRVTEIEHFGTHAVAHCADGTSYAGDIIVGADGVRSRVRQQMWKYMDAHGLKAEAEKEREQLTCEYDCVFGISSPVPGLKSPDCHRIWGPDWSLLIIIGKDEKVYWFMFNRLDRVYQGDEIPRFDQDGIDEHLAPFLNYPVAPNVAFAEVITRAEVRNWRPVEEGLFKYWCIDRMACIGDSIHKMTPNAGLGANSAIETAVSLANSIHSMVQNSPHHRAKDIERGLKDWQAYREERAIANYNASFFFVRLETQASLKYKLLKPILKQVTDAEARSREVRLANSEYVECLPPPQKSYGGTLPWKCHDTLRPVIEKPYRRLGWALPLLGLTAVGLATIVPTMRHLQPEISSILQAGAFINNTGDIVTINSPLIHLKSLDAYVRPLVVALLPSITTPNLPSWTQAFTFINDCSTMYGIWLLEGYHKRNSTSEALLPIIMGTLAQYTGIGIAGPLYYFLQYIHVPLSSITYSNIREIEPTTTYTLLPTLAAAQIIPALASFLTYLQDRAWYNAAWQLFPLTVPLLQFPLAKLFGKTSTESAKPVIRNENRKRSIAAIRVAYGSFAAVSAVGFLYARVSAGSASLFPGFKAPSSFSEGVWVLSSLNQVLSMSAGFVWLALRFRELKINGMEVSWWKGVTGLVGTTVAFGPGTAFALGWGWKEEMLHRLGVEE